MSVDYASFWFGACVGGLLMIVVASWIHSRQDEKAATLLVTNIAEALELANCAVCQRAAERLRKLVEGQ